MPWRQFIRTRGFHALWIGALLLALVIWLDAVWIWGLVVMAVAAALLLIEWFVNTWKGGSRDGNPD